MSVRVRQANQDTAGTVTAAAEVDAANGALRRRGLGRAARHSRGRSSSARRGVVGQTARLDNDVVAFDHGGVIGHQLVEIQDQACTVLRFGGQDESNPECARRCAAQEVRASFGQIERDARRVVDREGQRCGAGADSRIVTCTC